MENDRKAKLDAFWNIEQLVPAKKKRTPTYQKKACLTHITSGVATKKTTDSEKNKLHFPKREAMPAPQITCYENLSPLVKRVEIHPWKSTYHYYEFFCKNAEVYHEVHGKECERVPFFSYVAQYSQMNQSQLNWYFWWRENARKNVFLDTDISYIYLYIYEIINLGDLIDTRRALFSLIEIWYHYREIYPALNKALGEWICDYSLLNGLSISFPHRLISSEMIDACSFREAFFGFDAKDQRAVSDFLIVYCGGYQYKKSKFYGENRELYDEILPKCLARVAPMLTVFNEAREENLRHLSKVAFVGALCSYRIRKHIEIDYISVTKGELQLVISTVLKYSENMLRSYLGIRSRLGHAELPEKIKNELDSFFAERFSGYTAPTVKPEYEKLYEAKPEVFSLEKALDIERSSWSITEELIEEFKESVSFDTFPEIEGAFPSEAITDEDREPREVFLKEIVEYQVFFDAVVSRDMVRQRAFCQEKGVFPESAADFINEKAADIFGDILLEESVGGYEIIEDYRDLFDTEE